MKKLILAIIAFAVVAAGTTLFALNKNQSIDYVRTLNRNATTEVDGTFYNPAGLTKLKKDDGTSDGFYMHVSNQFIVQEKTVEDEDPAIKQFGKDEYVGNVQAYLFPDVHLAYKMGKFVFFGNFMPIGGGGGGKYSDGLPMFEEIGLGSANAIAQGAGSQVIAQYTAAGADTTNATTTLSGYSSDIMFEGEEFALGFTLGTAYEINDMFSVAAAYRLTRYYLHYQGYAKDLQATAVVSGIQPSAAGYDATATDQTNVAIAQAIAANSPDYWQDVEVDTEAVGYGHTFILGFNTALTVADRDMNIGFSGEYQLETEREYSTDTLKGGTEVKNELKKTYGDGNKEKITEPIEFRFGIAYDVLPDELMVEYDMTYNLKTMVDHGDDVDEEDDYQNMIYTGAAVEYNFGKSVGIPMLASIGYAFDSGDRTDEGRNELSYGGIAHHIGTGIEYTVMPDMDLSIAYLKSLYPESTRKTDDGNDQKLNQTSDTIGIGISYAL